MKRINFLSLFAALVLSYNGFSQQYYYVNSNSGQPWGTNTNINAMNTTFGAGAWNQGYFQSVNVATMLAPTTCLVFLEGGDSNANALSAFLGPNMVALQNWVFAGGNLIINSAPNQGGNINYGFGGILLNYAVGPYSNVGNAAGGQAGHPIFNGPFLPCGIAFTGNWWCHGYVTGPGLTQLVTGTTPGSSLAEMPWGAGRVMFGSMTTPNWHAPLANAANFLANVLKYMAKCCNTPTITAVATPTSICPGSTVSLVAAGAFTYTWSPGAVVGAAITVTPGATTTYTATGTNTAGCTGTKTVMVTVNPLPIITCVPSAAAICIGKNTTLVNGGAVTYTCNPGGLTGTNILVTPGVTTTYTISGTNASGCINTKTITITVNPLPIVVAANTSPICVGGGFNLNVGAANTYTWTGPAAYLSNLQNPLLSPAAMNMNGVYTVSVTDVNGCVNNAVTNVVVTPIPIISPTNTGPYCAGANINLNVALAGTSYTWTDPGGIPVGNTQNLIIPNGQPIMSGTYSVNVSSGAGCLSSGTTSVTVNPLPVPVALSNAPVCEGQSINFTGSGGVSYNWTGPSFNSNQQNPGILVAGMPNNGAFVLTVTDANGCINSTAINVVVNALPVVGTIGSTVCANQNITLGANGGTIFSWAGPAGFSSSLQNPIIPNANPGMAGVYNVTVTNANGCINTNFTNVIVNALPAPTASNNGPLCLNQLLTLQANGGLTYAWSGPGGFFASGQSPTVSAQSINMSGNYTVTASDNLGCTGTAVTSIVVNPLPNVAIVATNNNGCVPLCSTFTCATSPGASVNWSFGDGASAGGVSTGNCFKSAADYTVTANVTDANGCNNFNTFQINAYPIPVADFNFAPIKPIVNTDPVTFTDASYGATIATWNWYFTNTAASANQSSLQNPQFYYAESGTYPVVLVVKSNRGCLDTIIKAVFVGEDYGIYVPNAFTPNGDGNNDVFQPKGFGITKYEFDIFDRWGDKLFHTNNFDSAWDGNVNGIGVKNDIYTWRIKLTNVFGKSHELTGHVTLIK